MQKQDANVDTAQSLENWRKKLVFRSWHRGTREMDLLIGSFADAHVAGFGAAELELFDQILRINDPDLYNWVSGRENPPANLENPVLTLLLQHRFAK